MAQQPDINAILAALSAQRPSGTPQQGAQSAAQAPPPMPPGFPGMPQAPTPSNPFAGFNLPQPSNSGNLDLSGVKPSNFGNLDLADAVAKVQASVRGQADSRRSNIRSRSRSQSPRRDSYNSYNPYRDERRDGRNGRDRSYSPDRNNYSSRDYNTRSPPGRDDHGSEIITVNSSDVGLIIGRSGENLKRVEQETGARVQFMTGPENSGPKRQCKISGTARQRSDAIADIFRTAAEGPTASGKSMATAARQQSTTPVQQPGEQSMRIMVPDRTVGLIIGRGGETIRDLQERSGCHINIVGENQSINGLRPVNLIGKPSAANVAKNLILEVVESDTRGAGNQQVQVQIQQQPQHHQQPSRSQGGGKGATFEPYGDGEKINAQIVVPSEAVGMIIGKGGETIKDMQNQSGCKINVSPPGKPDIQRDIGLIGTRSAIESAKGLIWDKVNAVREKQGGYTRSNDPTPSYGANYSQSSQQMPAYGQQTQPTQPQSGAQGDAANSNDPYAAYGGYANYYAMWMAALANQGGQQQQQGTARPS